MAQNLGSKIKEMMAVLESNSVEPHWMMKMQLKKKRSFYVQDPTRVYFVESGQVLVRKIMHSTIMKTPRKVDNEIYESFSENELVAIENLSDIGMNFSFKMTAVEDTEIISIDKEYLLNFCANYSEFAEVILKYIVQKYVYYEERGQVLQGTRLQRLQWGVLNLTGDQDNHGLTHRALGKILNVDENFISSNIYRLEKKKP
ncbi:cyclic nucleotide-binding domain-containing protein [Listeria kieliensis]|uniref:Crp/Fnr family transcriptional regulator n=1 Tax=Listeria kieliensis TaxID=1621700 RepID=A0A3D8TTU0_9LIST|nr:Crp/Fnr family transcriptional regulator [Listeria kieliensis]RDX02219.1 hypothetical protein UR08_01420 [Listeria kieliensis]